MKFVCAQVLAPLRLRCHEVSSDKMPYDECYTEYIEELGLMPFIRMVSRSTPHMNSAAITSLVDRWRLETHSFYLHTGEMTVTLQDMSMILALPIEGQPLCIDTKCDKWRQKMHDLIGDVRPEGVVSKKGNKLRPSAGASFTWIAM